MWQLAKRIDHNSFPEAAQFVWVEARQPIIVSARSVEENGAYLPPSPCYRTNINYRSGIIVVDKELVELLPIFADNVRRVHNDLARTLSLPNVLNLEERHAIKS
jgi:hypothetical protein